jgi:hypothetical protein
LSGLWTVVPELTDAIEHIITPIAFICMLFVLIKEFAEPFHFILRPSPFVIASICIVETPKTLSQPVHFEPFLETSFTYSGSLFSPNTFGLAVSKAPTCKSNSSFVSESFPSLF